MARNPKPKPAPSAAPVDQAIVKPEATASNLDAAQTAAEQAAQTESTLGDGDATGAAQEAPSATAAPEAPAPDVVTDEKRGPEGWTVRVVGPAKGRWRAGRKFGPEPVEIPVAELTAEDLAKLEGDPELTVAQVPIED